MKNIDDIRSQILIKFIIKFNIKFELEEHRNKRLKINKMQHTSKSFLKKNYILLSYILVSHFQTQTHFQNTTHKFNHGNQLHFSEHRSRLDAMAELNMIFRKGVK